MGLSMYANYKPTDALDYAPVYIPKEKQMPHDKNGQLLEVGDIVSIECVVKELNTGEDFCNARFETTAGRRPDGSKQVFSAVNTAICVKQAVTSADEPTPSSSQASA